MSNDDTDTITMKQEDALDEIPAELHDTKISPQVGLSALALNMALKYHGINTVSDGALYQQYKLEGKNMQPLHMDMVFETAIQIEKHLLNAPSRLALMVLEVVSEDITDAIDRVASERDQSAQPEGEDNDSST